MATEIKLRRGTKAQHDDGSGFTGAEGEVTVDTTDDTLRVHDGSLKGGHVIAKLSDVEASDTLAELLAKGNSTGSNDIQVDGTDKVTFGAESGGKLEIYEDGSQNGVIKQTGTGALKISGIYGTLNNDSDEELISWDTDNAGLSWRGASGAGLKLFTKETGIGVTGTVNASDGLTADYIDLTGGKSTTTTGAICADQIRFSAEGSDEAKIYASVDGLNTSLFIQSNDDEADKVRVVAGGTESLTVSKTGIDVTGTVTADGVKLGDSEKIQLGDSNDLEIYHNGSHSVIDVNGTGNLILSGAALEVKNSDNNVKIVCEDGAAGAVKLSHGNTQGEQLATTATGINVTGELTTDSIRMGTDQAITFNTDNSNYSQLKRTAAGNTFLSEVGSGEMIIQGQSLSLRNEDSDVIYRHDANAAELYHRNGNNAGIKLQTTNAGIDVTGTVKADGLDLGDAGVIRLGDQANGDLKIYHNGSHSYIADVGTGVLSIESNGENIALHDSANARNMARFTVGGAASLNWAGGTGTGTKLATTATGIDVTGAVKSTKGFYTDYKNHGDFPTTDSWYTIAICKGRDAVTTIQRASGEFIVVDNTDAAGHETARFTASELFAQDALISVSEYLSYSATSINRFRIKSGNAFEGSALQVYASATTADLGVTLINDPYLQSNEGGWHLLDAPVIDSSDPSTPEGAGRTLGYAVGNDVNTRAWDWTNFTSKADTGFLNNPTGLTTTSGVSVGGDLEVTGTVEADAFSGTGNAAITDFITDVSASNNDTTVPTTAAVKSYVDNNDGDTTYTGGTGLTLNGTTFNVDAAQTHITSVGTLSGLTTGATTVNGALTVNNDYMELRGTNDGGNNTLPLLSIFRDVAVAGAGSDPLGGIVFSGRNEDDRKVSYASIQATSNGQADDGEHLGGNIVFTVADGSGAVDPFDEFNNGEFDTGHSVVLNASSTRLQTSGYLESTEGRLLLGSRQNIHSSALQGDATQASYNLHMPESKRAKVMQIGGIGPFDTFITGNQSVAQMLQYRGQHMVIASGGALEFELPACAASSTISNSTANIGDVWQISNATGGALTIDRDGSGTAQTVYHFPSLALTPFTNNPTLAAGGTMLIQAVAADTWMIFNPIGLTDA